MVLIPTRYVIGIILSPGLKQVRLMTHNNQLNGLIEKSDQQKDDVDNLNNGLDNPLTWTPFQRSVMAGMYDVTYYYAVEDTTSVKWTNISELDDFHVAENLKWIIPLAVSHLEENSNKFTTTEYNSKCFII